MFASIKKFNNGRYIFELKLSDDKHETVFLVEDTQDNNSL